MREIIGKLESSRIYIYDLLRPEQLPLARNAKAHLSDIHPDEQMFLFK